MRIKMMMIIISERQIFIFIYTTIWMLTVNVYIIVIYGVITVNYYKCILLFSPLNSHLYVFWFWILDFINKYYYYYIFVNDCNIVPQFLFFPFDNVLLI